MMRYYLHNVIRGVNKLEKTIKEAVNPVIQSINKIVQEGGYKLEEFNHLNQVEIIEIKYGQVLQIEKNLELKKLERKD